jgi:hypothetical protein
VADEKCLSRHPPRPDKTLEASSPIADYPVSFYELVKHRAVTNLAVACDIESNKKESRA